ncbi:MAG TPA: M1 family aminopeptidase [Pyrinomonadaceae bacterium]|nr:M1 family aminopeptidase [Pyrinomonadaceae bacterium]
MRFALCALLLAGVVLCGKSALAQPRPPSPPEQRIHYKIDLSLDFENRKYAGSEQVRWVNRENRAVGTLIFHLYSNARIPGYVAPKQTSDEPRLEILEVKSADNPDLSGPLQFVLDDHDETLRVSLHQDVPPGKAVEVVIKFRGEVPEIDPDETGLVAHVMQQVSAAIGGARELRRARDINFLCRGVMLLGTWYPVLAGRDGDEWLRRIEPGIGDAVVADVADYEVNIDTPQGISLFTPVEPKQVATQEGRAVSNFVAENLRDFAVIAGTNLLSEQRVISGITIRSIYRSEHEAAAKRALNIAANATAVYIRRLGSLPMQMISVIDAPLVATLSNAEFSGFAAIASAFYVNFDSPAVSSMPDIIREQRASVEESLEWTVAHVIAHQWWGATIGSDPGREPILDESLANWSALVYYRDMYGEQKADIALDEQLRGVYKLYRTFGGEDMEANLPSSYYRNTFQYSAIVTSKGALMFEALRKLLGNEKFFAALRSYYDANQFEIADMDDLRSAFAGASTQEQRRSVSRTFDRWLVGKRGDEDIAPPDPKLAAELGLPTRDPKNGKNVFSRVGKFFWQQMTRIR